MSSRVVSFFNHSFKGLCVYIPMRSLLIQVTYLGKLATFVLTKLPMLKTPLSLGMLFVLSYDCVGKPCLRCFLTIVIILILLATQAETLKNGRKLTSTLIYLRYKTLIDYKIFCPHSSVIRPP